MTFERIILLIAVGILVVLTLFMDKCFDFDIWLYRKWGWKGYADKWEARKHRWIRPIRWFCGALAAGFLFAAFFVVG
jgi:hypothetical protein